MIVVDTNVVAYFFIEGEKTESARTLWEEEPQWILPPLWRHEFLNVVATYCRAGNMSAIDAEALWLNAVQLLGDSERIVDHVAALQLAISFRISAYDAQFVSLAKSVGGVLVTEDKTLIKTFPETAISLTA